MEWVETTGTTIDEARLRALDTLGVAYDDAEIEILTEPKKGVLGFGKADARIRARVRPVQPRAKVERRDRSRRKSNDRGGRSRNKRNDGRAKASKSDAAGSGPNQSKGRGNGGRGRNDGSTKAAVASGGGDGSGRGQRRSQTTGGGSQRAEAGQSKGGGQNRGGGRRDNRSSKQSATSGAAAPSNREEEAMEDTEVIDAAGQASIVEEFLEGLLDAFAASGELESVELDEDTYEVRVHGNDLGLMIGPKGATMQAVQEVARTAVQQQADGSLSGRVHLDIGGYRNKRREALADFARRVADSVKESGERKVLEPMPAPDRKVIHDTVAEIDGVETSSEGEDRRRHIVLSPAD